MAMAEMKTKMDPDELARAVMVLVENNGDILDGVSFFTEVGAHTYQTVNHEMLDGRVQSFFRTPY
jgi:hypothetical protein